MSTGIPARAMYFSIFIDAFEWAFLYIRDEKMSLITNHWKKVGLFVAQGWTDIGIDMQKAIGGPVFSPALLSKARHPP